MKEFNQLENNLPNPIFNTEMLLIQKEALEKICLEFNPYLDTIPSHIKIRLIELGFSLDNYDPFKITNKLLKMLDDLNEKIDNSKKLTE